VKVAYYCDPSSAGTLTCVALGTFCTSAFATVSKGFTIVDHFFFVLVRTIRTSCIIKSPNQINIIIKFKSCNLCCPNSGKSSNHSSN
jgi:hypothetical protein